MAKEFNPYNPLKPPQKAGGSLSPFIRAGQAEVTGYDVGSDLSRLVSNLVPGVEKYLEYQNDEKAREQITEAHRQVYEEDTAELGALMKKAEKEGKVPPGYSPLLMRMTNKFMGERAAGEFSELLDDTVGQFRDPSNNLPIADGITAARDAIMERYAGGNVHMLMRFREMTPAMETRFRREAIQLRGQARIQKGTEEFNAKIHGHTNEFYDTYITDPGAVGKFQGGLGEAMSGARGNGIFATGQLHDGVFSNFEAFISDKITYAIADGMDGMGELGDLKGFLTELKEVKPSRKLPKYGENPNFVNRFEALDEAIKKAEKDIYDNYLNEEEISHGRYAKRIGWKLLEAVSPQLGTEEYDDKAARESLEGLSKGLEKILPDAKARAGVLNQAALDMRRMWNADKTLREEGEGDLDRVYEAAMVKRINTAEDEGELSDILKEIVGLEENMPGYVKMRSLVEATNVQLGRVHRRRLHIDVGIDHSQFELYLDGVSRRKWDDEMPKEADMVDRAAGTQAKENSFLEGGWTAQKRWMASERALLVTHLITHGDKDAWEKEGVNPRDAAVAVKDVINAYMTERENEWHEMKAEEIYDINTIRRGVAVTTVEGGELVSAPASAFSYALDKDGNPLKGERLNWLEMTEEEIKDSMPNFERFTPGAWRLKEFLSLTQTSIDYWEDEHPSLSDEEQTQIGREHFRDIARHATAMLKEYRDVQSDAIGGDYIDVIDPESEHYNAKVNHRLIVLDGYEGTGLLKKWGMDGLREGRKGERKLSPEEIKVAYNTEMALILPPDKLEEIARRFKNEGYKSDWYQNSDIPEILDILESHGIAAPDAETFIKRQAALAIALGHLTPPN